MSRIDRGKRAFLASLRRACSMAMGRILPAFDSIGSSVAAVNSGRADGGKSSFASRQTSAVSAKRQVIHAYGLIDVVRSKCRGEKTSDKAPQLMWG